MPYRDISERRAYGREWMKRNPEKARAAMRRWRSRHPDDHNAEVRSFYTRHREAITSRIAAYREKNPQVKRTADRNRRAREQQASGSHTTREWVASVVRFRGRCAYCGAPARLHADHRTPLSRGGTNSIDNILPACAPCNMSKHDRTESEYLIRKYGARLDGTGLAIIAWRVMSPTVSAFELAADK